MAAASVLLALLSILGITSPAAAEMVEISDADQGRLTVVGEPTDDPYAAEARPSFDMVANLQELTGDHATVFRLYWAFFLRQPDVHGALYWVERYDRCDSLGFIADQFAAGTEFATRYGQLSDTEFVKVIYRNVLGRQGEAGGLAYWTDLLTSGRLTRGEIVLNVSLSAEFVKAHEYPSDGVPGRSCRLPSGDPTPRAKTVLTEAEPLSAVGGLTLQTPASVIERVGYHQSTHPGALAQKPAALSTFRATTMESRNRGTDRRSAADVAVHPLVPITSPVSGVVLRAGEYTLYCKYTDGYVVIKPDGRPDLEVKVLHMQGVRVLAGDRIRAGEQIASRATAFPFRSQIDDYTAEPSWPHVHIEVVDPSVPRPPSSGTC